MANKPIKEYEDFSGEAGYLIVDSLTNETSGGKLKVPNYVGVTDGYVLTKTSNDNTDEVVWAQVESSGITNPVYPLVRPTGYNEKIELLYDSTLDLNDSHQLTVKDPIPDTTSANDGDVLTIVSNGDIGWAAPQGGGGNPYTKVSVSPGTRYKNGKTSSFGWELFDQDVSISNNTYSVINSEIGYVERPEQSSDATGVDVLKIKLPANTEFPMAVVEFNVYHYVDNDQYGAVNDVEVYVGDTKLTKLLAHPYRKDTLVGRDLYSDNQQKQGYGGSWYIEEIWNSNTLFSKTAFVATEEGNPIVQVNIFGNCFTISTNVEANKPAAS